MLAVGEAPGVILDRNWLESLSIGVKISSRVGLLAVGWVRSSQVAEAGSNGLVALIEDQLRVRNVSRASDSGVIVTAIDNIGGSEGVVSRCHRVMILIGARIESSNVIGGCDRITALVDVVEGSTKWIVGLSDGGIGSSKAAEASYNRIVALVDDDAGSIEVVEHKVGGIVIMA